MRKANQTKRPPTRDGLLRATYAEAMASKTTHAFRGDIGFVKAGAPQLVGKFSADCNPPSPVANGSKHWLQPPRKNPKMKAIWVMAESAWAMQGGKRLAFTAVYLGSHGWTYLGPVIDG